MNTPLLLKAFSIFHIDLQLQTHFALNKILTPPPSLFINTPLFPGQASLRDVVVVSRVPDQEGVVPSRDNLRVGGQGLRRKPY